MQGKLSEANFTTTVEVRKLMVHPPLHPKLFIWSGQIPIRQHFMIQIRAGAEYTLSLEDGRSGEIRVIDVLDDIAYFIGTINQP